MNSSEFDLVLEARLQKIKDVLYSKAKEYADGDRDRLHNFNKAAMMSGYSREEALWGFLLKHLVSVSDIIENTNVDRFPTREVIDEKIGDCINYFILLEACLVDRLKVEDPRRQLPF